MTAVLLAVADAVAAAVERQIVEQSSSSLVSVFPVAIEAPPCTRVLDSLSDEPGERSKLNGN